MTLSSLQRAAVERFKETLFAKSGGSCFECSDFEGMYVDLQSFLTSEVANVYEAVKALVPGEDTLAAHDEWQRGWQAGWKEYREVMIKRLSDGV